MRLVHFRAFFHGFGSCACRGGGGEGRSVNVAWNLRKMGGGGGITWLQFDWKRNSKEDL